MTQDSRKSKPRARRTTFRNAQHRFRWLLVSFCLGSCILSLVSGSLVFAEPRQAHVAGGFYPADPQQLRAFIAGALDRSPAPAAGSPSPRILILPHAGYPYSGLVAARGVREVQGRQYDAVVVVGFTHQDQFSGTSVDDRDSYLTPLGEIPVDLEAVAFLKAQPTLHHLERAHASSEHSLEVELPFLQVALGRFKLVPLLMGSVDPQDAKGLAEALAKLAARGNYLFVFSTDLSHYHPYDEAVTRDEATVGAITFETQEAADRLFRAGMLEACGRGPILTALALAQRLGYPERRLLLYANSGDTTGDKSRVVGYAAIGMYERTASAIQGRLSPEAGRALVAAARKTLMEHFGRPMNVTSIPLDTVPELQQARGMFVTLRRKTGELRGCIGRIESDILLPRLLPIVTLDAALHDSRFPPLTAEELDEITIEVSVLSPPRSVHGAQEIVAGRDGVILVNSGRSGVFLPQVWHETGWTRLEFLRELAHQKAGLEPDAWQQAQLFTFQDQVFEEMVTE